MSDSDLDRLTAIIKQNSIPPVSHRTMAAKIIALAVASSSKRPARLWRVSQRQCNYSHFNGRRYTPSDWSSVMCLRCGRLWRTKAGYVVALFDIADDERNRSPGHEGYEEFIKNRGRTPHTSGEDFA